jgi:signal transduction histidine kinase
MLIAITATTIVAACFLVVWFFSQATGFRNSLENKADLVGLRLQKTLSAPLWQFDIDQCTEILRSELSDADIGEIRVMDADGSTLVSLANEPPARASREVWAEKSLPIDHLGRRIGAVALDIRGAASLEAFLSRLAEQALIVFIVGVIVAFVLFLTVDARISRRIAALRAEIGNFSDRNLAGRATESGPDEIGDLARTFNAMADTIERYGRDLEGLVEKRTALLETRNRELVEANASIQERLAELKRTQDRLVDSAKLAEIGRIVAQIVHDLNTPVAAIVSVAQHLDSPGLALLEELPVVAAGLESGELADLRALVEAGKEAAHREDFRARRARRANIEALLVEVGAPHRPETAERLVDMEADALGDRLRDMILTRGFEKVLGAAEAIVQFRNGVRTLKTSAERADRVLKSLRSYLHKSRESDELSLVNLAREIENILVIFDHRTRKGIIIERDLDPSCEVRGRKNQLDQVWMNLIDNALQSMGENGQLGIVVRRAGGRALVEIIDSGPGIPGEIREKLFQPFFTTKIEGQGTGLGLSITRRIVEEHGGTVSFASVPGSTKFVVDLPERSAR